MALTSSANTGRRIRADAHARSTILIRTILSTHGSISIQWKPRTGEPPGYDEPTFKDRRLALAGDVKEDGTPASALKRLITRRKRLDDT